MKDHSFSRQIQMRSWRRRCSLLLVLAFLLTLSFVTQPTDAAATSILGNAVVSSKLCNVPEQYVTSIPSSFVILLPGQSSANLRPQQSQQWPKPSTIRECTTLGFWTRADSDHDLIDDITTVKLSDDGTMDGERNDDDTLSNSKNSSLESYHCDSSISEGVSTENNLTTNEFNATGKMDNHTSLQGITIGIDNSTTLNTTSRWKRISSIPGLGVLLPGTPLFMRLMPIKSSEIISRLMEETPIQNDVQMVVDEFQLPPEREQIGLQEDKDSETADHMGKGEESLNSSETHSVKHVNETENGSQQASSIVLPPPLATTNETLNTNTKSAAQDHKHNKRRRFFQRKPKSLKNDNINKGPVMTKEELQCPVIATNIHELQSAVLINKTPLRDVGFRFPVKGLGSEVIIGQRRSALGSGDESNMTSIDNADSPHSYEEETIFLRDDPIINGSLSSLLTRDSKSPSDPDYLTNYRRGIELINLHPVLSVVRERVEANSKPGDRLQGKSSPEDTIPHLALVIEGGGMRGAVSAGMAAALSTLDLLDAFDSIHGSSAGAIVGAYLVSRQLCTDVYTDIMPAAGRQFASKRRGALNFGIDWLGDQIQRKILSSSSEEPDEGPAADGFCAVEEDMVGENSTTSWRCEDDDFSSVDLAMGRITEIQSNGHPSTRPDRYWSDDHYDGVVFESINYLLSNTFSKAKSSVSRPLSFGVRRFGRAIRPALSAFDFASSMRQYLRHRPGMNLTYILDGIMEEKHGLRPFDVETFRANDKRQPLYIVASTVNKGGKGEMQKVIREMQMATIAAH